MPEIMPTGNSTSWMLRIRDKGILYKVDLLSLIQKAGLTEDAYGNKFPEPKQMIKTKKEETDKKAAKLDRPAEKKEVK